tara:strand:+ start:2893 stop:3279 length:387 start_codon:yes stop_codon:yes gene_type:complete
MNLKNKYKQLFEGKARSNDSTLTEAPSFRPGDDYGGGPSPQGSDAPGGEYETGGEPFDLEYYSDQINQLLTSIDDFHQELGTNIEMKSQETGDYKFDAAEKQVSRYINVARKGLEDLQKYLERQKGNL